jgi:hypothetical protein
LGYTIATSLLPINFQASLVRFAFEIK